LSINVLALLRILLSIYQKIVISGQQFGVAFLVTHQSFFNLFSMFFFFLVELIDDLRPSSALEHKSDHTKIGTKKTKSSEKQFAFTSGPFLTVGP
jgi:hypothetical protein